MVLLKETYMIRFIYFPFQHKFYFFKYIRSSKLGTCYFLKLLIGHNFTVNDEVQ